ncbi:LIM domain protein, partial [Oesophagostomum dentatum]
VCVACHAEITADKPGCTALDQVFHVDCFKCKKCDTKLAGSSFYNIDNSPICDKCYQASLPKFSVVLNYRECSFYASFVD